MKVDPFSIETESEADAYLGDLFSHPEYRSLDEAVRRANTYISEPLLRKYFIDKAHDLIGR